MARFKVSDIAYFNGSGEKAIITNVRERGMVTFYQVNNGLTWIPDRMLWDGDKSEKVVFCSQLQCQRKMEIRGMVKGVDYIDDQYGFPMCKVHVDNEQWT